MSRMDWGAMVAQLEEQRATTAQDLADIDAVIATVRQRANGAPVLDPKRATKAALRAKKAKPAAGRRNGKPSAQSKITDAQLATMRKQWEAGVSAETIAKQVKVHYTTVYGRAKAGGWKRPKPGAAASPAAAAPIKEPAGTRLSGSVRCTNPQCGSWTDYDPCRSCGQPLKRKWS